MFQRTRSLVGKLALIQTTFLVVALASIAFTLWVSWQLEGGAGAINEAGRMRMMTYRLVLAHYEAGSAAAVAGGGPQLSDESVEAAVRGGVQSFDGMVRNLRDGDPDRPLFVPDNAICQERLAAVQQAWPLFRQQLLQPGGGAALRQQADAFVFTVDELVGAIERTIATRTALLGGLCFGLVVLVVGASVVFVSGTFVWIIQPLQRLRDGLREMTARQFSVRIDERNSVEEFSTLAAGFNQMADALERSYKGLELKVADKTASLALQNARLASLYEVAMMGIQGADTLESQGQLFALKMAQIAGADAVAVRLAAEDGERLLLLGQTRLPKSMQEAERCVRMGSCACGEHLQTMAGARVIPVRSLGSGSLGHCEAAGYQTVVAVPMRSALRTIGEVELFYYGERRVEEAERQHFDALVGHFATQIENLRLAARDREMAISEERNLLAQELHDSIAQSLAFLKIQVQLLRTAMAKQRPDDMNRSLEEIDTGVRESYADVRELLLHFRTRPGHEDIEHALRTTLSKFELQSGLGTHLTVEGHGVPLPPDQQIQVLHVIQEALSNVRKHSGAHHVSVRVRQEPQWYFEVSDDGKGFEPQAQAVPENHVGLRIMRERADRIGAKLVLGRRPGGGMQVGLTLARATTAPGEEPSDPPPSPSPASS
ncbi:type IV pili methyl-accepting chemotaxis transducer N-terminal domain-containing protein [Roseateles koreensis]|uniref:Sensor protein n=1 Tax=Roseateles koreensis TaxID=2987526 RepID=A0ABT5KUH0_9BURK|nr:type IV pili methyl-accepting chemotaxis transducer N-terminal domain-containing protein [Roseateles koreensis]MDC8786080.1 type IV pili methyl-accepting chemotaxis transducer N-terminal domain-containing protein [Roseateles koreensis]